MNMKMETEMDMDVNTDKDIHNEMDIDFQRIGYRHKFLRYSTLVQTLHSSVQYRSVPHSKSGAVPMSSLSGVGSWGYGKLERVG